MNVVEAAGHENWLQSKNSLVNIYGAINLWATGKHIEKLTYVLRNVCNTHEWYGSIKCDRRERGAHMKTEIDSSPVVRISPF